MPLVRPEAGQRLPAGRLRLQGRRALHQVRGHDAHNGHPQAGRREEEELGRRNHASILGNHNRVLGLSNARSTLFYKLGIRVDTLGSLELREGGGSL